MTAFQKLGADFALAYNVLFSLALLDFFAGQYCIMAASELYRYLLMNAVPTSLTTKSGTAMTTLLMHSLAGLCTPDSFVK